MTRKLQEAQRGVLNHAEQEIQFLSQINSLKTVNEENSQKLSKMNRERLEATQAFEKEKEYFEHTENSLRIANQRLKEAVKAMSYRFKN